MHCSCVVRQIGPTRKHHEQWTNRKEIARPRTATKARKLAEVPGSRLFTFHGAPGLRVIRQMRAVIGSAKSRSISIRLGPPILLHCRSECFQVANVFGTTLTSEYGLHALTLLGNNRQGRNWPNQICGISVRVRAGGVWQVLGRTRGCSKERLPVACAKHYSYLSATMGSRRIARRAGM